jgi:histidinol-phosphate phosphatase family protein
MSGHPAVFLDRDGTVVIHHPYLDNAEDIELIDGVAEALRRLAGAGYLLVLVTNQSGVGRGYYPESVVLAQHARLAELLAAEGLVFSAYRYCPHGPEAGCTCRKPLPGMILDAAEELAVDLAASWMVGDAAGDTAAGRAAGCRAIRLGDAGTDEPDAGTPVVPSVVEAAALILANRRRR